MRGSSGLKHVAGEPAHWEKRCDVSHKDLFTGETSGRGPRLGGPIRSCGSGTEVMCSRAKIHRCVGTTWEQCAEYRTGADDPKIPQLRRARPYSNNAAHRGSACTEPQAAFQAHAPVIQPARWRVSALRSPIHDAADPAISCTMPHDPAMIWTVEARHVRIPDCPQAGRGPALNARGASPSW